MMINRCSRKLANSHNGVIPSVAWLLISILLLLWFARSVELPPPERQH